MDVTPVLHRWRESLCHRGRCKGQCKDVLPQQLVSEAQTAAGDGKDAVL